MTYALHHGDCLEVLRTMADASVDAVVTDPPYGLAFMGKRWDYDVPSVEVWAECLRVLKPGGHLLAFAGTRTQHRMACRIEDAGFEIRDLIMWCYGSGFPKSTDISKRIDLEEKKRWLDVCKALDSLPESAIMDTWKEHLRAASTAGLSFAKNLTATGTSTPKSGFAPEPVLLQASQENSDVFALVAELSSKEALPMFPEVATSSAPMPAAANGSQNLVKCAEHLRKRSSAISTHAGIAQCVVKEWRSENIASNLKAAEALKTWLGSKPSSKQEATNALCVALTADLKHIILSQSKTYQSADTILQTGYASAISVTTTEYMAECLISYTVDTLRKEAIDKAAGAEREVVGAAVYGEGHVQRNSGDSVSGYSGGLTTEGEGIRTITAPATPEAQQWAGWGTALKPALEPITMARKPLAGTVAACVLQHGTGAINVDGCRIGIGNRRMCGATNKSGQSSYVLGARVETHTEQGRWPANLIHDGSDEVVGLFPEAGNGWKRNYGESDYLGKQYGGGVFGGGGYKGGSTYCDTGSAARFFYTAKASASERQGVAHPTVKPLDLMAYLCRLVAPPGGIVLDPFMGSGTTIKAAVSEGFNAIGIERDPSYFAMAEHRMNGAQLGLTLEPAA
jgi:DNA modification methylase